MTLPNINKRNSYFSSFLVSSILYQGHHDRSHKLWNIVSSERYIQHLNSPVISGIRVTRTLVLYVYFVDRSLSFCIFFSFGHCVFYSSIDPFQWKLILVELKYLFVLILKVSKYWPMKLLIVQWSSHVTLLRRDFICIFCRSLFILLYFFSFGHCVFYSSIYGFGLSLWYLQSLLSKVPWTRKCLRQVEHIGGHFQTDIP
jgi:hypothetical protein